MQGIPFGARRITHQSHWLVLALAAVIGLASWVPAHADAGRASSALLEANSSPARHIGLTAQPATQDAWRGEYFNNRDLQGSPVLVRNDPVLDFDWDRASPQPGVVNDDNFSVRWTRTLQLTPGVYRFRVAVDDGMRLFVNDQLVINQWRVGPTATFVSPDLSLSGNTYVRVEYFDAGDNARIQVLHERVDAPPAPTPPPPPVPTAWPTPIQPTPVTPPLTEGWLGEYYSNPALAGAPGLVRIDPNIDFNWGWGSPAPGIPADEFSVRWTRALSFAPNTYRFTVTVDDGVRLWVNNALIVDQWRQQGATTYSSDIFLPGGIIPIRGVFRLSRKCDCSPQLVSRRQWWWRRWRWQHRARNEVGASDQQLVWRILFKSGPGRQPGLLPRRQPHRFYLGLGWTRRRDRCGLFLRALDRAL
ncbi:MAG: hypothetical protein IPK16_33635 [Anaerolineales bacterium]|nr:hypothetical protein [Anaerolineales bacterium]